MAADFIGKKLLERKTGISVYPVAVTIIVFTPFLMLAECTDSAYV